VAISEAEIQAATTILPVRPARVYGHRLCPHNSQAGQLFLIPTHTTISRTAIVFYP
jgi:hypothetical protein